MHRNHSPGRRWSLLLTVAIILSVQACHRPSSPEMDRSRWIEETLSSMSLSRMVSQLFIVPIPDTESGFEPESFERLRYWAADFGAGGIVFLQRQPMNEAALTADLQKAALIPLFVAQDMEWGAAMRVPFATEFPSAMGIGASGDPDLARTMGAVTAREARALGVNLVLAPVADVLLNAAGPAIGTRSFGDDPDAVAAMVRAFVRGAQDNGVLATAKHFPGHGAAGEDSHISLPLLDPVHIETDSLDLKPFQAAIDAGVGAMMTGHLAYRSSDSAAAIPATLSRVLLDSLLRKHMGFQGLIISDALNMGGVTGLGDPGEVAVRAVEAGVDLLLMSPDPRAARRAILHAVRSGRLPQERIESAVRRILTAKARVKLTDSRPASLAGLRAELTRPAHRAAAARAARRSIVLLKDENELPITGTAESILFLVLTDTGRPERGQRFIDAIHRERRRGIATRMVDISGWRSKIGEWVRLGRKRDLIIVTDLTSPYRPQPNTVSSLLSGLQRTGKPIVLLAMGSPFSVRKSIGLANTVLVTFGGSEPMIHAVSDALFGRASVCGRLPVTISDRIRRSNGLCIPQSFPRRAYPEEAGLKKSDLRELDSLLYAAVEDSAFPGAAVAIGRGGLLVADRGYGNFEYDSGPAVTNRSLFDLASLTKVIATTTAMMQMYEQHRIELDDPVVKYLPAFGANGKNGVTIRHLLTHTAGLIPFRRFYENPGETRRDVIGSIFSDSLVSEPGSVYKYSDFGPIVLALIVEKITGTSFDGYVDTFIFKPLGMLDTGYRSVRNATDAGVVPTEEDNYFRNRLIQGVVHDETAYLLGGTAGHAGLFSTVDDLARFAYMMLHEGRIGRRRFLKPETIRLFTAAVDPERSHTRALGWDTRSKSGYSSAGHSFGPLSYGHTGFTGTSIWLDPDASLYVILLTNRVYPTRENKKHVAIRPQVADLVFSAQRGRPDSVLFKPDE